MNSIFRVKDESGRIRHVSVRQVKHEASAKLLENDPQAALALLSKAVAFAPGDADVFFLLGEAQTRTGALDSAIQNLQKAVELNPNHTGFRDTYIKVCCELGDKYLNQGRPEDALEISEQALHACSEHPGILGNKSVALFKLARYDEAIACALKQLQCKGTPITTLSNLCVFTCAAGQLEDAERFGRLAISLDPTAEMAHYNLALVLLVAGKYLEGFEKYEWRWQSKAGKAKLRHFTQPLWDGSAIPTKRLLIYAEQGAGDLIQFVRFLPLVKHLAPNVILQVPGSAYRLIQAMNQGVKVVTNEPSPDNFDLQCPLLRLPLLFRIGENPIPPPQRFYIPRDVQAKWETIIPKSDQTRIGVVWAGSPTHENDRNRSVDLAQLAPLLASPAQFFSFQVGPAASRIEELGFGVRIQDLSPQLTDYLETAGALLQMDLVISVDTSVIHLAASLGLPAWMMVPFAPDWRWLLHRADSPWYPTLRLFRQTEPGNWKKVVELVNKALAEYCNPNQHPVSPRPTSN